MKLIRSAATPWRRPASSITSRTRLYTIAYAVSSLSTPSTVWHFNTSIFIVCFRSRRFSSTRHREPYRSASDSREYFSASSSVVTSVICRVRYPGRLTVYLTSRTVIDPGNAVNSSFVSHEGAWLGRNHSTT